MWLERSTTMGKMEKLALLDGTPVRAALLPYAHHTIEADDIAAVTEALASDWITQGPTLARFERALADRAGAKHAVAFASGTAALHGACWAAGLGASDEAITTPLTFAATANAVVYQGAWPVFADIDATTLNLDPDAVKRAATPRTRAVLSVDFAGLPCEYDRLLPLAREHGWAVIADAAHSFGGAYGRRPVGALADMTTLSCRPAIRGVASAADGSTAWLASLPGAAASRPPVRRPGHDPPGPACREHRCVAPLRARLPASVLPRALQIRSRIVPCGRVRRAAARHAPTLRGDDRARPGRCLARARQGLRLLRAMSGHGR